MPAIGEPDNPCLLLDEVVHQRTRLALLCELSAVRDLDFNTLRDRLRLSDGNLARHLTVLKAAALIATDKRTEGTRRRTYARLTDAGRAALRNELHVLAALVAPRYRVEAATGAIAS
jgi:DNA-binding MarR family transcriptional regulator